MSAYSDETAQARAVRLDPQLHRLSRKFAEAARQATAPADKALLLLDDEQSSDFSAAATQFVLSHMDDHGVHVLATYAWAQFAAECRACDELRLPRTTRAAWFGSRKNFHNMLLAEAKRRNLNYKEVRP